MSLFPQPAPPAPEPKWLAEARRRSQAVGELTSITAKDRAALLAAYDELAARLSTVEAAAAELKQELAEQEMEKLRLVEEVAAMKLVDIAHRERNRRIIVAATAPPLTFDEAEKLANAGWTPEKVAQIGRDAAPPAPLLEEAVPAALPGKCQSEFGPCIEHCGQCKGRPATDEWISVKDRLPTAVSRVKAKTVEGYEVLAVCKETDQGTLYLTCVEWDNPHFSFGLAVGKVVEWCPEPEPTAALPATGEGAEPISGGKEVGRV